MSRIHPLSDVRTTCIGENTKIWQFAVIMSGAIIGRNCNINCHTFIENNVVIGDNVTIKSGVYLWDGVTIEDDVFLGPNVVFTNDLRPRSKRYVETVKTVVKRGASIGANTTILCGVTIGEHAMTGIMSNVTRNVPSHALVYGSPAKVQGWVDEKGEKLVKVNNKEWISHAGRIYIMSKNGLIIK